MTSRMGSTGTVPTLSSEEDDKQDGVKSLYTCRSYLPVAYEEKPA
jgi:hypothetical protein